AAHAGRARALQLPQEELIDGPASCGVALARFVMLRGAGSLLAIGHRISSGLVILGLAAQGAAVFAPVKPDPCSCSEAACCRAARRPAPARAGCHDAQPEPSASLKCHHPEQEVRLPATIALLPVPVTTAPAGQPGAMAGRSTTSPLPGFSRLDLPPPRSPRVA